MEQKPVVLLLCLNHHLALKTYKGQKRTSPTHNNKLKHTSPSRQMGLVSFNSCNPKKNTSPLIYRSACLFVYVAVRSPYIEFRSVWSQNPKVWFLSTDLSWMNPSSNLLPPVCFFFPESTRVGQISPSGQQSSLESLNWHRRQEIQTRECLCGWRVLLRRQAYSPVQPQHQRHPSQHHPPTHRSLPTQHQDPDTAADQDRARAGGALLHPHHHHPGPTRLHLSLQRSTCSQQCFHQTRHELCSGEHSCRVPAAAKSGHRAPHWPPGPPAAGLPHAPQQRHWPHHDSVPLQYVGTWLHWWQDHAEPRHLATDQRQLRDGRAPHATAPRLLPSVSDQLVPAHGTSQSATLTPKLSAREPRWPSRAAQLSIPTPSSIPATPGRAEGDRSVLTCLADDTRPGRPDWSQIQQAEQPGAGEEADSFLWLPRSVHLLFCTQAGGFFVIDFSDNVMKLSIVILTKQCHHDVHCSKLSDVNRNPAVRDKKRR